MRLVMERSVARGRLDAGGAAAGAAGAAGGSA